MTLKEAQELRSYYVLRDRITKDAHHESEMSVSHSNNHEIVNKTEQNIFEGSLAPPAVDSGT